MTRNRFSIIAEGELEVSSDPDADLDARRRPVRWRRVRDLPRTATVTVRSPARPAALGGRVPCRGDWAPHREQAAEAVVDTSVDVRCRRREGDRRVIGSVERVSVDEYETQLRSYYFELGEEAHVPCESAKRGSRSRLRSPERYSELFTSDQLHALGEAEAGADESPRRANAARLGCLVPVGPWCP